MFTEQTVLDVFGGAEEIFNDTTEIKDKLKKESADSFKVYVGNETCKLKKKDIISLTLSSAMINGKEVFILSKIETKKTKKKST